MGRQETFEMKGPPGAVPVTLKDVPRYVRRGYEFLSDDVEAAYNSAKAKAEAATPGVTMTPAGPTPTSSIFASGDSNGE